MSNPPPLGYQSYQHQSDAAFLSKWGKRLLILWLTLVTTVIAVGLLIFLFVGGCTLKVISDVAEASEKQNAPTSGKTATPEAEMAALREKIGRQLDTRQGQIPKRPQETTVELDQLRKPIIDGAETLARGIAKWDLENAQRAGREAKRKHEERVRASYQGFPGHYDGKK